MSDTALGPSRMTELLGAWAREVHGSAAGVAGVRAMPGNAGLSFGFSLHVPGNDERRLVVRLAPPGVARRGNTDVLRQVPLLQALDAAGVPVAAVRWSTADPALFGTDAFVVDLLPGAPLHMWEAAQSIHAADPVTLVGLAVDALADLHAIDWHAALPGWDVPRSCEEEIDRWAAVLERCGDATWIRDGLALAAALRSSVPAAVLTGLLHGDFQTNNVLFHEGRISGIVDWELAGIGPQLLDLGWLMMWCDTRCWEQTYRERMRVRVDPGALVERYAQRSGGGVPDASWYQALACFRFGAIAAYNARLHRSGRRVDPLYEVLAPSVAVLFEQALRLLTDRTVSSLTDG